MATNDDAATPTSGPSDRVRDIAPFPELEAAAVAVVAESVMSDGCAPSGRNNVSQVGKKYAIGSDHSPTNEALHCDSTASCTSELIISPRLCLAMLYACFVQSVQVTLLGTSGMLPADSCSIRLSIVVRVRVPVYGSRLLRVSVTHKVLLFDVLMT